MADWILRAEGVSFDDTVFNTNDLSTVRGSSLTLEAFVHALEHKWLKKTGVAFTRVYYGGSQVAFQLHDVSETRAEKLAAEAREHLGITRDFDAHWPPYWDYSNDEKSPPDTAYASLHLKPPTEHMRIIVEIAPIENGVRAAINRAMWKSRRRQMLAPNLPTSPGVDATTADIKARAALICPIDPNQTLDRSATTKKSVTWVAKGQFPKVKETDNPKNGEKVFEIYASKRSADLRTYGRDARRMLYPVQLGRKPVENLVKKGLFDTHDFAQSFHQIVANPPVGISESVKGKLAYLHFDGNGFSKIRAANDLGDFAKAVEKINAYVLNALLDDFLSGKTDKDIEARIFSKGKVFVRKAVSGKPDRHEGKVEDHDLLRLETLLFGGEDFVVVLPAWLAWEFAWKILGWYSEAVKDYARKHVTDPPSKLNPSSDGFTMTHRCGMLICNQKMPVRRARNIATALCEDAKRAYPKNTPQAALAFHVIESHDVPEETGNPEADISLLRRDLYSVNVGATGRFSAETTANAFRLLGANSDPFDNALISLKSEMARSRLYQLIGDLDDYKGDDPDGFFHEKLTDYATRGRTDLGVDALLNRLGAGKSAKVPWNLHLKILADLWDYVDPFDDDPAGGAQ